MHIGRSIALCCFLVCGVADAATFSLPLQFEVASSGSNLWLEAPFDLGLHFEQIQSATVSITLQDEFTPSFFCTGYSCYSSQLLIDVVSPEDTGDPFAPDGQQLISFPSAQNLSDNIWQRQIGWTVYGGPLELTPVDDEEELLPPTLVSYIWPDGLLQGRGTAVLALESTSSGTGLSPNVAYSRALRLPDSMVLSATLTVTGQPVPEPSSMAVVAPMIGVWALHRRFRAFPEVAQD